MKICELFVRKVGLNPKVIMKYGTKMMWLSVIEKQQGYQYLFNCVSKDEFRGISTCKNFKDAWDNLETTHEGTKGVKRSKLQALTSRFDEIKMKDEETVGDFYAQLCDIVKLSYGLGENISETKVF